MIDSFSGAYEWLSNFSNHSFSLLGTHYKTNEHFYQSMKMKEPTDAYIIRLAETPGQAKRLSRKFPMKENWDEIKVGTMMSGLYLKFAQNPDIKQALISTGDIILVEGNNWHDNFWGVCNCKKCKNIIGLNILGKQLMQLRGSFK